MRIYDNESRSNKSWGPSSNMSCSTNHRAWTRIVYHMWSKGKIQFIKETTIFAQKQVNGRLPVDCRSTGQNAWAPGLVGRLPVDCRSTGDITTGRLSVDCRSTDTGPWAPGFLPVDWLANRSTAYSKLCTFVHIGRLPPLGRSTEVLKNAAICLKIRFLLWLFLIV